MATTEQLQFASDLALMKERAFRIGLYATGQLMEKPLRMVGYELAGTPELYEQMETSYAKASR